MKHHAIVNVSNKYLKTVGEKNIVSDDFTTLPENDFFVGGNKEDTNTILVEILIGKKTR